MITEHRFIQVVERAQSDHESRGRVSESPRQSARFKGGSVVDRGAHLAVLKLELKRIADAQRHRIRFLLSAPVAGETDEFTFDAVSFHPEGIPIPAIKL